MSRPHVVCLLLLMTFWTAEARADDRLERIMLLWPSRDFESIRAQTNEALMTYHASGDLRREAIAYLFLGLVDAHYGDAQNVRWHLGEASSRFEASQDYVGAWLAYWLFAEHERWSERQSEHVRTFYEKSLAMIEQAKSPAASFSLDALMVVGPVAGVPPAEYEPATAAFETHKARVLQLLEAFSRTGYGAEYLRIGELENADAQLQYARNVAAIFDGRLDPPIDHYIGNLRRKQWRLDEARNSYLRALEGLKVLRPIGGLTPKRLKVDVYGGLAELEMLNGRIDDALRWNDEALRLVRAENNAEVEILVLRRRAEMLVRAGRFSSAEQSYAQALSLSKTREYFYMQIPLYLSIARMNISRGRYGTAAAEMENALEALSSANEPFTETSVIQNLAMCHALLGVNESARFLLQKARQLAERNGRCVDVAAIDLFESTRQYMNDEISLSDFHQAVTQWIETPDAMSVPGSEYLVQLFDTILGSAPAIVPERAVRSGALPAGMLELVEAGALFSQGRESPRVRELALRTLDVSPNAKHRASAMVMIAGTYVRDGDDDQAIAYFSRAIDTIDAANAESGVDSIVSNSPTGGWSTRAFELLMRLLVKHGRDGEAFAVSERARARVFLRLIGNTRVTPRGPENTLPAQEAETLRTQILQWQLHTPQPEDDLREARQRYEALMTRIKAANPEYAAMTTVDPLQLDAIREALPPETTLVNYFLTDNIAHAWVLDRKTMQYVSLPFGPAALERANCAAKRFRAGGRGVVPHDERCDGATSYELYDQLFAPLRRHVHNRRLIIVPHSVLHYLPFGAFLDPRTERYLIEDYTITYVPSASSIGFLRNKETTVKGNALVIGAPAGVSPELPGAMREAKFVGAALHSVPKVGADAKESLLYQMKGDVDLVHIAAHGFYDPDTPLFSRIALAGGDGSDGDLEVGEILSDVDLTGVNLVVLSACQSGVGKDSAGDEVVGFTRALLYAGTPGVISTLWDIGDDPTALLMNYFYSRLLSGDSAADALRYAQLQLLHGEYGDPRQWAAFTLNGNPEGRWTGVEVSSPRRRRSATHH